MLEDTSKLLAQRKGPPKGAKCQIAAAICILDVRDIQYINQRYVRTALTVNLLLLSSTGRLTKQNNIKLLLSI
jgi:hypothetical protein